jgi:superfamily II DNA or RNA helicase
LWHDLGVAAGSERELSELRGELGRLRAENFRLSRLLDLQGQDTAPASEQLAVPMVPGLVTMASPVGEKLALYADRFRARRDVYAVHWANRRAGTDGWMPAVAGRWRKGMDRRSARYLPLTTEVMAAHLAGEVFVGLYPLLNDNSCWFLVADFDGGAAMLDALAYAKAARSEGVPAAVELSKSGRGAHVWVFFAAPVVASVARAMGTVLLREAMVLRGSMDLRSYDRLFPNQDVMPEGGFGNLIAAPLQRRYRDDGLTVFLDLAPLEPYADQWAFLSTLDRCSPTDVGRVARRAKQDVVGPDIARMWKSEATKVQPRLPSIVRAELGATLAIPMAQLPPAAVATFKHAASMANPKFYELQRLRKSTWDTPRFVRAYDITVDDRLVLPRALRHAVSEMVEQAGSTLSVTDVRHAGTEIDVAFSGELDQSQSRAVSAMLAHDDGVLVAPPGSGKTVMACAAIAERATSTLILVDRKALAEQWRSRIEEFLGFKPGQHGAGRKKLTGIIDIAMLPSLARHGDVEGLTLSYGQVIVDECHHLAAAAYDHSVKKIGAQFWLGLTATPVRRDGLGNLVTWQLGPVRHTLDQPTESTLIDLSEPRTVASRLLYVHDTEFEWHDPDGLSPSPVAAAHGALVADGRRSEQIVTDVVDALRRGRSCLVLTRRVAHLDDLASRLRARGKDPMILQGGMSAADRRAVVERLDEARAGDGLLVVGTTPYIGEGFDAPVLDTLFLAAPISFEGLLVQCAGRVVRAAPGKTTAEVHDYHDVAVPILASSLQRRMPGYRTLGFNRKT